MRIVINIEANGLKPTHIWNVVLKDIDTGRFYQFTDTKLFVRFIKNVKVTALVGHNLIAYDLPVIKRLLGVSFDERNVYDTLVVSQLLDYTLEGGHSLENWGRYLGYVKGPQPPFDRPSPELLQHGKDNVEYTHRLYNHLQLKARVDYKDQFSKAIELEHRMAFICQEMHTNGFAFNKKEADKLYVELDTRIAEIDKALAEAFPPKEETIQLKTKVKIVHTPFNPASTKQIVERLAGFWDPKEKTDTGKSFKVNEANLATLKEDAPEGCKRLVERLLLAGRQRALKQWLEAYDETSGRIHGTTAPIGTWTHRASHRAPNTGNIATKKSIKYKGKELAALATSLGGRMRGLWEAAPGKVLVGTDADQIQLRVFADLIDDPTFTNLLVNGDKKKGTDLHSAHCKLLEVESRDDSKTWIYAYFLGMGDEKSGFILGGKSKAYGRKKKLEFAERYPGLKKLRETKIPEDAKRGYYTCYDGRIIKCDSEHHMLAGYLQSGEVAIMKRANVLWKAEAAKLGIPYKQVAWVHDEWVCETDSEYAKALGDIQRKAIIQAGIDYNLKCPLEGETKVGLNWLTAH